MTNLRNRPKGNYIQEANWDELHLLIENWKKDLEFYLFDIKFLKNLVKNHFSELLVSQNLDELRELQIEVYKLQNQCEYILECIQNNLDSIVDIINDNFIHDTSEFRIENEHLEDTVHIFITKERKLRKSILSMIKDVIKLNNQKKYGSLIVNFHKSVIKHRKQHS